MSAVDATTLRSAFGRFMTGVTVVTTRSKDGPPVGFTANSFTSVSLEPPLLLVCPGRHLSSFDQFRDSDSFAVSILAEGQEAVANTFARSTTDRFAQAGWSADALGCPVIEGCAAAFSCTTNSTVDAGDHLLLIGEITHVIDNDLPGLGYNSDGYFSLTKERQAEAAPAPGHVSEAGAIIEHDGHVLLVETERGLTLPQVPVLQGVGARTSLAAHFATQAMHVTFGPVYSIFDDPGTGRHFTYFRAHSDTPDPAGQGAYYPISAAPDLNYVTPGIARMMRRFSDEHRNQNFGLYFVDTSSGEFQSMHGE